MVADDERGERQSQSCDDDGVCGGGKGSIAASSSDEKQTERLLAAKAMRTHSQQNIIMKSSEIVSSLRKEKKVGDRIWAMGAEKMIVSMNVVGGQVKSANCISTLILGMLLQPAGHGQLCDRCLLQCSDIR